MKREYLKVQRLIALFAFGYILFNFPILSLFDLNQWFWGIPGLFVYLFAAWLIVIMLMALVIESGDKPQNNPGE